MHQIFPELLCEPLTVSVLWNTALGIQSWDTITQSSIFLGQRILWQRQQPHLTNRKTSESGVRTACRP